MNTVELFSGTGSFSKVAKKKGWSIFRVDNDPQFETELCKDIIQLTYNDLPKDIDILWASPPCTAFSVASIGTHWGGGHRAYLPKTDKAREAMLMIEITLNLINQIRPKYWFIENPRGVLRKLPYPTLLNAIRHTVTYCQYGDSRMKPTDIWTNCKEWKPKPICKNGDPCHTPAPRGSKTGTQGLKGSIERGVIPPQLFEEIFGLL